MEKVVIGVEGPEASWPRPSPASVGFPRRPTHGARSGRRIQAEIDDRSRTQAGRQTGR